MRNRNVLSSFILLGLVGVGPAAALAEPVPPVGFGANGLVLRSPDDGFQLRIRSVIQTDARVLLADALREQDTFLVRRARLYVEGTVGGFLDYRIMPDFAGSQVQLFDAWVNARPWPALQLRAGKMKTPFGLERLQSEQSLVFAERGLTQALAPDRDVGATLHGDLEGKLLSWEIGVLNGVADGASADVDGNFGKDLVARVFGHPLRPLATGLLDDIGVGVAVTYGKQHGSAAASGLAGLRTAGQQAFFGWLAGTVADGERIRVAPQLYAYVGPAGLLAEYVYSSTTVGTVTGATGAATLANQAWQVQASLALTLEHPSYDGLKPRRPFDPALGQLGAFELAARVGQLVVDDAAFPRFADPAKSARRALEIGGQANWYLTANVRAALFYARTTFDGGGRGDEDVLVARGQVAF